MFTNRSPGQASNSVLLVTDFLFQPAHSGNRKRVASLVSAIGSWGYSVHVVALDTGFAAKEVSATAGAVDQLELVPWRRRLDPYGLPEATTFSGRLFKKAARGLRKAAGNWPPALDPDLEDRCPAQFRAAVKQKAEQLQPLAVIVEYIWLSRCLLEMPRGVHRIIDLHDLMHQRLEQYRGSGLHSFFQCTLKDELKCLRRADSLLLIQKQEQEVLRAHFPETSLLLTPHGHEVSARSGRDRGKRLVFLGSAHAANLEGIKWFLRSVWPLIRNADPEIELQLVGAVGPAVEADPEFRGVMQGVNILGLVDDVTAVLSKADVMINPILRGSGLKIKAVEALCCGLPVVSTSKGVEGIVTIEGCAAIAIADEPDDFCEKVLEFLLSGVNLSAAALEFCAHHFSADTAYGRLREALDRLGRRDLENALKG